LSAALLTKVVAGSVPTLKAADINYHRKTANQLYLKYVLTISTVQYVTWITLNKILVHY